MKAPIQRALALCMAAALVFSLAPAAAAQEQTVTLSSAKDFAAFSQNCARDVYSQGLTVELTADLDLTGENISPVPIFQGTFHGNGHTISGLSFDKKGSKVGLFRTLTQSAVVEDLTVKGDLAPQGSAGQVGLLAGENYGTLRRCTAVGSVAAQIDGGGLVGLNGETGLLEQCDNQAQVSCPENAGGIAGQNLGTIQNCANTGAIDTDPAQDTPTSAGGIAGLSRGNIRSCRNSGPVGYQHLGYNMGGIAGLQSGEISGCTNSGAIYGRKDVGGISGQMEPSITITSASSAADRLNSSLSALISEMGALTDQMSEMTGRGVEDVQVLHDAMSAIQDRTHAAGEESRDDFLAMSDQLDQQAQTVHDALNSLRQDVDHFSDQANDDLNDILSASAQLRGALDDMLSAADSGLSQSIHAAENTANDMEAQVKTIRTHLDQMGREIDQLEEFIAALLDMAGQGSWDPSALPPFPSLDLGGHLQAISGAVHALAQDLQKLPGQLAKIYDRASSQFESGKTQAEKAAKALEKAAQHLVDQGDALESSASGHLDTVSKGAEQIRSLLKSYSDDLSGKLDAAAQDIDDQLTVIQDRVESMNQALGQDNTDLHATSKRMLQALDGVRAAIADLDQKPELTVTDLSEEVTQGPGLIQNCTASGKVEGDSNVGGIVGTVSSELGDDPESTFHLEDTQLLADTYATLRAVVSQCRFDGDVSAKNDCAGGVVGRAEAGSVLDSAARGTVTAGTDYCGGIAGRTQGKLIRCAALTDLSGDSWLGGIAGLGKDLTDCRAMVRADSEGEYQGAIAGQAEGTLSGNRYLMEELAGVDGVDWAEEAQGLSFAEFSQLSGIPQDFLTFSYRFVVNGQTVAEIPFQYGGDLDQSLVPQAPQQDGQYGQWPQFPTQGLTRSLVLEAQFQQPTATLSSGGEFPDLLAQGVFSPEAQLTASETDLTGSAPKGFQAQRTWNYTLSGSQEDTVTLRLRVREGQKHPAAALYRDGAWQVVDSTLDGSYLVFEAPVEGQVLLLEKPSFPYWAVGLGVGGAAVLAAGFWLLRRRKHTAAA